MAETMCGFHCFAVWKLQTKSAAHDGGDVIMWDIFIILTD